MSLLLTWASVRVRTVPACSTRMGNLLDSTRAARPTATAVASCTGPASILCLNTPASHIIMTTSTAPSATTFQIPLYLNALIFFMLCVLLWPVFERRP